MNSQLAAEQLLSGQSPAEVAKNLDLDPEFVREVADALADPRLQRGSGIQRGDTRPFRIFQRIRRPWLFVFVTSLLTTICQAIPMLFSYFKLASFLESTFQALTILGVVVGIGCQVGLFAHLALVRLVPKGYFFTLAGVVPVLFLVSLPEGLADALTISVFATLVLAMVYFPLMGISATLGSYARLRRESQDQDRLTRQQLLEQLFELRARRSAATQSGPPVAASWLTSPFFRRWGSKLFLWTFAAALVKGLLTVVIFGVLDTKSNGLDAGGSFWFTAIQLLLSVLTLTYLGLMGLAASHPVRSLIAAIEFTLVETACELIPLGKFGLGFFLKPQHVFSGLFSAIAYNLLAIATATIAMLRLNELRKQALIENRPEVLDQEIARLEQVLSPPLRRVCVMDVDAYQSSVMKMTSDPFEAEWSFREYQALITRVASRFLGTVHSTAGDGAIVGFPSSADALSAAIHLQAAISVFNRKVNRLKVPFRIRIGLHTGELQGNLDEIQFTEVIDVAAHVQKAIPVGRIGLTSRTIEHLPKERFSGSNIKVDGYDVYLLNNVCGPEAGS